MGKKYIDVDFEIKGISESGTFDGYGAVFKNKDEGGDVIEPGAFAETLAAGGRNGFGISMLWQHNPDEIPGVWTELSEDNYGLAVKGQLALKTTLGKDTYELMLLKAIKGMSIGYNSLKGFWEYDQETDTRHLKKVKLWEVSLVTFPMNIRAQVTGIKAFEDITTERELEKALREAELSRNAAKFIVKLCRPGLRELDLVREKSCDESLSTILEQLKNTNKRIGGSNG